MGDLRLNLVFVTYWEIRSIVTVAVHLALAYDLWADAVHVPYPVINFRRLGRACYGSFDLAVSGEGERSKTKMVKVEANQVK